MQMKNGFSHSKIRSLTDFSVLFTALLLSIFTLGCKEKASSDVKVEVQKYLKATQSKDYDEVLDYMPEKMWNIVPRDAMKQALEMSENSGFSYEVKEWEILDVSEEIPEGGEKFVQIKYFFHMVMSLGSGKPEVLKITASVMEKEYPGGVEMNEAEGTLDLRFTNYMIGIWENNSAWKFIENKKGQEAIMAQIVPEKVLSRFKDMQN